MRELRTGEYKIIKGRPGEVGLKRTGHKPQWFKTRILLERKLERIAK